MSKYGKLGIQIIRNLHLEKIWGLFLGMSATGGFLFVCLLVYMCVCVCVCYMYACLLRCVVHVCVLHVHMCKHWFLSIAQQLIFWDMFSHWSYCSLILLNRMTSKAPKNLLSMPSQHWDYMHIPLYLDFYMSAMDPNSDPHAWMASPCLNKPSPQPLTKGFNEIKSHEF